MSKIAFPRQPVKETFFISVVTPMHNEEQNVDFFLDRTLAALSRLTPHYEIICINDGSMDGTLQKLIGRHQKDPSIKVINFSRNFGQENALTAGIDAASGDAVIPIDADLQDPPELIATLVERWKEGYDIVYATRRMREGESILKRFTASLFYRLINKIGDVPIPRNTGDFRLLDRRVVEALKQLPETGRFMKGLFSWVGFRQISVLYDREPRHSGLSSWGYWKLWNFALDGVTAFSCIPLRIWTYIGLIISLLSMVFASYLILLYFVRGVDVPGYSSLMVVILFLGGMIMVNLGILGEYVGRIFIEAKKRPLYFITDTWGIEINRNDPE